MSKRITLAVLALLGFSTACSTVKNTQTEQNVAPETEINQQNPAIRVLYGVRPPKEEMKAPENTEIPAEQKAE